jgi:uncharacterized protein (TIGR02186 family)
MTVLRATVVLAGLLGAVPAAAEGLVTALSTSRVQITSNFTGVELALFGLVESDAKTVPHHGAYDIVVTVTGPRETVTTFRKERVLGIWVNADSRTFLNAPSYLAVLANREINAIAERDTLRTTQTGLARTLLPQLIEGDVGDSQRDDPFRQAFLRLKIDRKLYREEQNAVTFLSLTPAFFRSTIPLPDNVPTGSYLVDVKVFADGKLLTRGQTAFEIVKVGFEQFVANAAREHGLFYGLATAMMALLTGWFASVVFRKD